ncbi:MAG: hypothetical protein RBU30_19225 [Polyangia bacterium]|jgi:hypothetical protein|nr:hypothetical protein [Polyangia bacterium]
MRIEWVVAGATILAVAACGPKAGGGSDARISPYDGFVQRDGNQGTDGSLPDSDATVPLADGSVPGPDGSVSLTAYCMPSCGTVTDCDQGSAAYDSDNYDCVGGACYYTGCVSDTECQSMGSYLCRQPVGYAMPLCLPACGTVSDCDLGSAPYSPDNYTCSNGVCVYTGCVSDAECQSMGSYVCRTQPQVAVPYCLKSCSTPTDCSAGSAAYDEDNYDCLQGACVYTGCNSQSECQSLGAYTCVQGTTPLPF